MATPKKATPERRRPQPAAKETLPDGRTVAKVSSPSPMVQDAPVTGPDPEVTERAMRRRFTAEYKLQILRTAAACTGAGELGALLRREGLYSSHLTTWRRQREAGSLAALAPKKRGRPGVPGSPLARRVAELERENAALTRRLQQAETIIAVQKKVSTLLGIPLNPSEPDGSA